MKTICHLIGGTLFAALVTLANSLSAAPTFWNGAAGDTLWSSGANWSPAGAPGTSANVIFTNDGVAGDVFTVNNLVDLAFASPAINALGYMNTNGFHHTEITDELRVLSSSTTEVATTAEDGNPYVFFVGSNQWQDDKDATVYTTISGNSLTISNGNANFGVTQISSVAGAHKATLNLSQLNNFTCVVSNVLVGHNFTQPDHAWRPNGELYLARNNSITAKMVVVADVYQNAGPACYIHFGAVNTINADEIRIGMHKTVGVIDIAPGVINPSVTFRNAAGTGRQLAWKLGDEFDDGTNYLFGFFTSNQARGTMDLTGASVDAFVDRIVLGRGQIQVNPTNRTGDGNGTLIFGGGVIDVNDIEMGIQVPGPFIGGSVGHGILTVNDDPGVGPALLIVRNNIVMAVQQAGAPTPDAIGSTGDITVNGGSIMLVGGDIISGGPGGGTATITLNNGGLLDMQGDASCGDVSINTLNIADGMITNYATLSLTNLNLLQGTTGFAVHPGQSIAPAGVNKIGPLTASGSLILLGTTLIDIHKDGATLTSDSITAAGSVELGGTLKVSFPGPHTALAPGDKFTLFSAAPLDSSLEVVLPPPGPGLAWANKIFEDGSIEVIPCGCGEPTTPPRLTVTASTANATVSWPSAYTTFVLRSQTNALGTNWGFVPGVLNNSVTIPFQTGNKSVYFHLTQQ
jgi:hypothetical protein